MSAVLKPLPSEMRRAELDQLSADVALDHELRLDVCQTIPLERRGRIPYKRPRSAIISWAAQRAISERESQERLADIASRFAARRGA